MLSDRTFAQQALPYFAPYVLYVALSSLLPAAWNPAWGQAAKCCAVSLALVYFRRSYRPGRLHVRHAWAAAALTPAALLLWVAPVYALRAAGMGGGMTGGAAPGTAAYFTLRLINSVVLVALFEELLMRVFLLEWTRQADASRRPGRTLFDALLWAWDARPGQQPERPLGAVSVLLTTLFFAAGHAPVEYPSAILYFLLTTWLYAKTGSLWACILVHALTNFAIAGLVRYAGLSFLW